MAGHNMAMWQCTVQYSTDLTSFHSMVQCWKIFRLNRPENMVETLCLDENDMIAAPGPRLQFTLAGFRWRVKEEWNAMPQEIRMQKSLPVFKRSLKIWMKQRMQREPD